MNRSRASSSGAGATLVVSAQPRRPDNGNGVVVSFDSDESSDDEEDDKSSEEDDAMSTTSSSARDESDDSNTEEEDEEEEEEEEEEKTPKVVKPQTDMTNDKANSSVVHHDEDDTPDSSDDNEHEQVGNKVTLKPTADSDVTDDEEASDAESESDEEKQVENKSDAEDDDSQVEEPQPAKTQVTDVDAQSTPNDVIINTTVTSSLTKDEVAASESPQQLSDNASTKNTQNEEQEICQNSIGAAQVEPTEDMKTTTKSRHEENIHAMDEDKCQEEATTLDGRKSPSKTVESERSKLVETPELLANGVNKVPENHETCRIDDVIEERHKDADVDLLNVSPASASDNSKLQPEVVEADKSDRKKETEIAVNVDENQSCQKGADIKSKLSVDDYEPLISEISIADTGKTQNESETAEPVVITRKVGEEREAPKKKKKKKAADRSVNEEKATKAEQVNEESSFTEGRRNSIDDFIKRILAEAREEQKRRTSEVQNTTTTTTTELAVATTSREADESQEDTQQDMMAKEKKQQPESYAPDAGQIIGDVRGDAGVGAICLTADIATDSNNLVDITENRNTPVKSPTSMLDRRLASTERKREQEKSVELLPTAVDDSSMFTTKKPLSTQVNTENILEAKATADPDSIAVATASKRYSSGVSEEIDRELAELSKIFAKRTPLNVDNGTADSDDMALLEAESGWLKSRSKVGRQTDWSNISAVEGIDDEGSVTGDRPFSCGRRLSSQIGLSGAEEFTPSRRPETDGVIRDRLRPVKAIIEQQTDVIHKLLSIEREVSQLDDEINSLRNRSLVDRKLSVDAISAAVAEEMRLYESEQQAADERIARQLRVVHFVREQFVAASMSNLTAGLRTGSGIPDRRAIIEAPYNSVSSRTVPSVKLRSLEPPSVASYSRRAQSVAPSSSADDKLESRRSQRGLSMSRDVTDNGGENSTRRRSMTSNSVDQRFSAFGSELSDTEECIRRSRLVRAGSVGPASYSSASSLGESSDSGRNRLTTNKHSAVDSTSGNDISTTRRYSQYRAGSEYSSPSVEPPSDYRRANNYTSSFSTLGNSSYSSSYTRRNLTNDVTSYRYPDRTPTYAGSSGVSSYSSGYSSRSNDGEFRSKFLDKVRERKAKAAMESDNTSSYSNSDTSDKPFRSRFLRSDADSQQ